ncbi:hypothetical protein BDZ45DRAFT_699610 [Acephala macrosclerotiorum]|nr:hypothetical protein BDZ45DRAFT_699610 [Acephala macrosclerotiorum]
MPSTVQGNAIKANATYNDQQGERYCFECFERTKNGEVDPFVDHFFVDRCPLIDELINRQVTRGPFDYNLDKRFENAQRIQESIQFTAQERSKASANREILRGPDPSSHTFNGNNINVQSLSRATIDKFYEELPVNTVIANTVTTSKSRSKIQSARENLRRRVKAKEKYLRAGSQRQTLQGAQNEKREEMNVDQSEDKTLRQ